MQTTELKLGNQAIVRENSTRSTEEIVKIALDKIKVRPDFNVRANYGDIEGLGKSILNNGQISAGRVDVLEDGTFLLVDGHRRFEALKHLEELGFENLTFKAIVNGKRTSEEQRIIQMFTTQDNKQLEPAEVAELIKRLFNLGYDMKTVADKIGKSVSYVSQMLDFANEAPAIKEEVAKGTIAVSTAVKLQKEIPNVLERIEAVKKIADKKETTQKGTTKKASVDAVLKANGQDDRRQKKARKIYSDLKKRSLLSAEAEEETIVELITNHL